MSLDKEIQKARHNIVTDGYDMSIGEIISLYKDGEIIINPVFQRLFRWTHSQKTRFVESLLLGIPIPPIFVYQNDDGVWELIDGLQRLSTIFEFVGILRKPDGSVATPSVLEGTRLLPSLANKSWEGDKKTGSGALGHVQQLEVKRARMRVEILKKESDSLAKYELFQRLNTGGSHLSEQEVRNAVMVMVNEEFYHWLTNMSHYSDFIATTSLTKRAMRRQYNVELALRFFVYRNVMYQQGLDVHEYLNEAMLELATQDSLDYKEESRIFESTFALLNEAMGEKVFRRWDGHKFMGQFLLSAYEVIAYGVSRHIDSILQMDDHARLDFIRNRVLNVWQDSTFRHNSGAGVRGTTRLTYLVPIAPTYFEP